MARLQVIEIDQTVLLHRQVGNAITIFLQPLTGIEHRLCSVTAVIMWLPFSRYISATPCNGEGYRALGGRSESKDDFLGVAPISFAMRSLALFLRRLFGCPTRMSDYGWPSCRIFP